MMLDESRRFGFATSVRLRKSGAKGCVGTNGTSRTGRTCRTGRTDRTGAERHGEGATDRSRPGGRNHKMEKRHPPLKPLRWRGTAAGRAKPQEGKRHPPLNPPPAAGKPPVEGNGGRGGESTSDIQQRTLNVQGGGGNRRLEIWDFRGAAG